LAASQIIQKYVNFSTPLVCSSAIKITRAQATEESSKSETRNPKQIRMFKKTQNSKQLQFGFGVLNFL